jgi:hypothetical protein
LPSWFQSEDLEGVGISEKFDAHDFLVADGETEDDAEFTTDQPHRAG